MFIIVSNNDAIIIIIVIITIIIIIIIYPLGSGPGTGPSILRTTRRALRFRLGVPQESRYATITTIYHNME